MRLLALVAFGLAGLSACGAAPLTCPSNAAAVTYTDVAPLFTAHCTTCHSSTSSNRQGAPSSVNFDTYAAATASASKAKAQIEARSMPPLGQPTMTDTDRCTLTAWIGQGTPK